MYFCVVYCICDSVCLIVCFLCVISDGFGQFIKAVSCLEDRKDKCDADGLDAHK